MTEMFISRLVKSGPHFQEVTKSSPEAQLPKAGTKYKIRTLAMSLY